MNRVVVIGASVAALRAVERLKEQDRSCDVTFLFLDEQVPAVREYFPRFLAQAIKPQDVFYRKRDYFERAGFTTLFNKKIDRINFKKNRITTSEKEQIAYDALIISELSGPVFPDIKGKQKTGVFCADGMNDIKQIFDQTGTVDTIAIQSDSIYGLKLAAALATRKKEILLIVPSGWTAFFNEETDEWITRFISGLDIRLLGSDEIVEILGDADAKAVRFKNGKVMASQMVIYTDLRQDVRILQDSELKIGNGIDVDRAFRTSVQNVFAVDAAVCRRQSFESMITLYDLERQGDTLLRSLMGESVTNSEEEVLLRQFDEEEFTLDLIGQGNTSADGQFQRLFDKDHNIFRSFFIKDGALSAALLINDRKNLDKVLRMYKEKVNLTVTETLFHSNI
jgi:3-phenylpropionate/trans-cinnamate dioxygenase ferredoxin reductase component